MFAISPPVVVYLSWLLSIPLAFGFQLLDTKGHAKTDAEGHAKTDAEADGHIFSGRGELLGAESNSHLLLESAQSAAQQRVLDKVADSIAHDGHCVFSHLSEPERGELASAIRSRKDTSFMDVLAPPSPSSGPVLVQPCRASKAAPAVNSLMQFGGASVVAGSGEYEPSADFQAQESAAELVESSQDLPWGVGSPRTGDSLPNFHYSGMPMIDFPKEWEYSLEAGDTIRTFSSSQQDVKLLTQVLFNVTNGYFLDTNAGDGEMSSNTLLLELAGWRGLLVEPRSYWYLNLWGKMRKAWLFLGAISPNENFTRLGFNTDGDIDMLSGHMIHSYPVTSFLAEMGGRKTIDFWNLNSGGYEFEILNETLLGSGKSIEIGVINVRFKGRMTGRGYQDWVTPRTKDATEGLVFDVLHKAGFSYIGGLDAYFINKITHRMHYHEVVWVNPAYFQDRDLPVPASVKAAPPPELSESDPPWAGFASWDGGYEYEDETKMVAEYFQKSKAAALVSEPIAKASRAQATKLVY